MVGRTGSGTTSNTRSPDRLTQAVKAAREIGDQVLGVLEPDMQANDGAPPPWSNRPQRCRIVWEDEAFEAAPACPDGEQRHVVHERVDGRLRLRLQHDRA